VGPSEILFNSLFLLVVVVVVSRHWNVDEDGVSEWARSANVELTPATRPIVHRYLTWSRRSRTLGGLIGLLAPMIYSSVFGGGLEDSAVVLMIVGYLLGALLAEIVVNRPTHQSGSALLVPRRLSDYLPKYVLVMQRGLALVAVIGGIAYIFLEPQSESLVLPRPATPILFGAVAVVIALVIEAMQRTIVARRQSATGPDEIALDDAMRSSSLHVLAGAGLALLMQTAGAVVIVSILTLTPEDPQGLIALVLFLPLFLASLIIWFHVANPRGFRVSRGDKPGSAQQVSA
jgi:hypothetical protein